MNLQHSTDAGEHGERHAGQTAPPSVLQILPSLETGGAERGCADVALALARAGGRAFVVSSGGRMVREIERGGVTHIALPAASKNPFVMRRNAARLVEIVRAHKIDILHARSRAPAWSAYWAAKRAGCRFMTTVHGPYSAPGPKRWYNAVMVKGQRVIAISEFIARYVETTYGAKAPRVRVIHRGLDLNVFDPQRVDPGRMVKLAAEWRLPDGAPVVMLPGRLTRWKGQTVLIEALAKLGRTDICAVIVGSDQGRVAYREELEHLAERRGIGGMVRLLPDCRDMPAAYMLADVVVSASTDPEAFGRVAAEAQAMGRPVIATDHGASRETVIPGETGVLVPPGDADKLAEALAATLALDAARRAEIAAAAMAHIRAKFTKDAMCRATLALYAELAAEAPAA
ncbi:MAG: glycosyltransferase family 4 protein [Alphaproteobacteria bacterium]|nr:glycosyltransferase family 4 protein [Alphaproteobacteria bacterium]